MRIFDAVLRRLLLPLLLLVNSSAVFAQFTETPYPMGPGRFLLKVDAISVSIDKNADHDYTGIGVGTALLSVGLTPALDLQVGAQLFYSQRLEYDTFTDNDSGLGAVTLRAKWQFYSDGATAAALVPYVRVPTHRLRLGNDGVEGGVIVPWAASLAGGFQFVAQAELGVLRNTADDDYDIDWGLAAYLHRDLPAGFGIYGEAVTRDGSGGGAFEGSLGAGLTFTTRVGTWDYATYKGLSHGAADWTYVLRYRLPF